MTETASDYLSRDQTRQLRRILHAIADWIADALDDTIARQNRFQTGPKTKPTKKAEQPLPYHQAASDAATDMSGTLDAWISHVCQQRNYPWPGRLRIADAARWLANHTTALALCEQSLQAADEIIDAHKRVLRVIDRPRFRNYQGPCQICGGDMWAWQDAQSVTCSACGEVIDKADNDRRIEAELEAQLCTAKELVALVADRYGTTIKPKTVHDMAYRKNNPIVVRGSTYEGEKLYRAGDVFADLRRRDVIA